MLVYLHIIYSAYILKYTFVQYMLPRYVSGYICIPYEYICIVMYIDLTILKKKYNTTKRLQNSQKDIENFIKFSFIPASIEWCRYLLIFYGLLCRMLLVTFTRHKYITTNDITTNDEMTNNITSNDKTPEHKVTSW